MKTLLILAVVVLMAISIIVKVSEADAENARYAKAAFDFCTSHNLTFISENLTTLGERGGDRAITCRNETTQTIETYQGWNARR